MPLSSQSSTFTSKITSSGVVVKPSEYISLVVDYAQVLGRNNLSYGVNTQAGGIAYKYMLNGYESQVYWEKLQKLRMDYVRVDTQPPVPQIAPNIYNWTELDWYLGNMSAEGTIPILSIFPSNMYKVMPSNSTYATFWRQAITRYNLDPFKYGVRYVDLFPEWLNNTMTSATLWTFIKVFNNVSSEIHKIDPRVKVGGMGFINRVNMTLVEFFIKNAVEADFIGLDWYAMFGVPLKATDSEIFARLGYSPKEYPYPIEYLGNLVSEIKSFMQKYGRKLEIVLTETNYYATNGNTNVWNPTDYRGYGMFGAAWYASLLNHAVLYGITLSNFYCLYGPYGLMNFTQPNRSPDGLLFPVYWTQYLFSRLVRAGTSHYTSSSSNPLIIDILALSNSTAYTIVLVNKSPNLTKVTVKPQNMKAASSYTVYTLDQTTLDEGFTIAKHTFSDTIELYSFGYSISIIQIASSSV